MKLTTQPTSLSHDPLEVFDQLAGNHEYCFLLETLADKYQPQTSSQSYIGVAPKRVFTAKEGQLYVDDKAVATGDPYQALQEYISFQPDLPAGYVGGFVGYFSHEAIQYNESSLKFPYARRFDDFAFAEYTDGLVFRPNQAPEYFCYDENRKELYEASGATGEDLHIEYQSEAKGVDQYNDMVQKARVDIQNGRAFQIVLANKYSYKFSGDLLLLYKELRRINPSPFMFFMKFGDVVTLGASPELLVHTSPAGRTYLEALAGTIRRGKDDEEDAKLAAKLLADQKEVAEHSMLVDLARNDVGRISAIGSVQIDDLMYIKKLSHVQHISSIISGKLETGRNAFDALAAAFPAGTLSGAPKIEAIKMITELETEERGPYGGTIGYFGYNGDSVHAVNIRSVSAKDNQLYVHSGSGIVYDSNPASEYNEINQKKAALDAAMQPFLKGQS